MASDVGLSAPTGKAPGLPLFYRTIERLNARRHASLGIVAPARPDFARNTNSVPLAVTEFAHAMANYPIVFIGDPVPMPCAILGLDNEQNLFVTDHGTWAAGTYVPAYVRRYPFLFVGAGDGSHMVLGVDTTSGLVAPDTDRPLFRDGQQTDHAKLVIQFCQEYQKQIALTEAFCREVNGLGLFEERTANVKLPDGRQLRMGGFRAISQERLDQLPEETFLGWRRRGFLPIIYWHLGSQGQWPILASRLGG